MLWFRSATDRAPVRGHQTSLCRRTSIRTLAFAGAIACLVACQSSSTPSVMKEGEAARDLPLELQNGNTTSLGQWKGRHVVLFFYPQDDTPGCRIEAQGFRDHYEQLRASDTVLYGVSMQGATSHQAFIDKERLPFDLVVDTDGKLARAFGVQIKGNRTARDSVWIGKDGVVQRIWRGVSPDHHAAEVLAALRQVE